MPELAAVIWDMDGVIADTAPHHLLAWKETFVKRGVSFSDEDFRHSFGIRNDAIIRNMLGAAITDEEINAIADEKEAAYRRIIGRNIRPLSGALELLKVIYDEGIKMALASSTPPENADLVLGSLGIVNLFQAIVTSRDVTEGKPSPQVFLVAAQRLKVEPANCLVIEDAVAGVRAAKSAGMGCLAVTNTHPRESLGEANLIVDSLEEVTVNDLEELAASS